tara:strand:- start:310 stop:1962 length:1653 start_codon:yes stop_codon:yes gene_type:complete
MIKLLSIRNLLLIDKIDLSFNYGLCVLTGETGAGKSMILDSLNLIIGERAKSSYRPENKEPVTVTALVDISNFDEVKNTLNNLEIKFDDEILVKRIIGFDGKSRCFINENIVTTATLKLIFKGIIEIHSQFSEQGLLDSSTHINILDDAGDYNGDLKNLEKLWINLTLAKNEYDDLLKKCENEKNTQEDLEFDIKELKLLNPLEGEYKKLLSKRLIIKNSVKITQTLNLVMTNFQSEDPPGIEMLFSKSILSLDNIKNLLDSDAQKNIENLNSILLEAQEALKNLSNLIDTDFNMANLDEIEERIELFKKISKKHNIEEESLHILIERLSKQLNESLNYNDELKEIKKKYDHLKKQYKDLSYKISTFRKKTASKLDHEINNEFPTLKLENAKFQTFVEDCEPGVNGLDKVTFKIKTNPKSQMDLIKNISSGGELCRIALAIKVIAQKKNKTIMVFDEVDSGIGGAVSSAVGERLKRLGLSRQVIVVTHSPQVAAYGNDHFIVKKNYQNNDVKIHVDKINNDQKVNEVARMLSGKEITDEAIEAAKKLIQS